jgi:hypothetical protein
MKTFLVVAAVLGVSSSAAFADCAGHVTASAKVDKEVTTASVSLPAEQRSEDLATLKRDAMKDKTSVTE